MNESEQQARIIGIHEEILTQTFDAWRSEFRSILENHRREIQDRLEKIEREIEKKSDKENVDIVVKGIREELVRHANEIHCLHAGVSSKLESETVWKIVSFTLTLGGLLGGLVGFLIHVLLGR